MHWLGDCTARKGSETTKIAKDAKSTGSAAKAKVEGSETGQHFESEGTRPWATSHRVPLVANLTQTSPVLTRLFQGRTAHCLPAAITSLLFMNLRTVTVAWLALISVVNPSHAAFHIMQVEQVIGGINGATNAQAIQLRMRAAGQSFTSASSLWAWDAAGTNRILLVNISGNVTNGATGAHILLSTASFTSMMVAGGNTTYTPDFTLANAIPASYLNAGRLTLEDDSGSVSIAGIIYWSLSWGGAAYTGSESGNVTNDPDGNFGPAFALALPSATRQSLAFTGAATAASTSNATDYALSGNPATVTRNDGTAFTVVPEPGTWALLGSLAFATFSIMRRRLSSNASGSRGTA